MFKACYVVSCFLAHVKFSNLSTIDKSKMELHSYKCKSLAVWTLFLCFVDRLEFCNSCEVLSNTNAQIERRAFGAGLHRSIETVVWVSSKLPLLSCSVVLQEFLPPGAYVDPEQLASLQRRGAIPPFVVGGPVDVEVGEWAAAHSKVVFYPDMVEQTAAAGHDQDTTWLVNFTTPLHVRYHRPRSLSSQGSPEAFVRLPHPGVLLQCTSLELPENCLTVTVPLPCAAHDAMAHSLANNVRFLLDDVYELFQESHDCHRNKKSCSKSKGSVPKLADAPQHSLRAQKMSNHNILKGKASREAKHVPDVLRDNLPPPVFGVPFADGYPSGFSELPTCYWLPLHTFSTSEGLSLSVPIGDLDHLELVLFVTTAVTSAAALLLLTPVLRQYRQQLQPQDN